MSQQKKHNIQVCNTKCNTKISITKYIMSSSTDHAVITSIWRTARYINSPAMADTTPSQRVAILCIIKKGVNPATKNSI